MMCLESIKQPRAVLQLLSSRCALVVKLVDAPDSKSGPARGAGSIPARGTTKFRTKTTTLSAEVEQAPHGAFFVSKM